MSDINAVSDFLLFLLNCVRSLAAFNIQIFLGTLAGAACFSGLVGWGCGQVGYLWNRAFRLNPWHWVICGLATVCSFAIIVVWVALGQAKEVGEIAITGWSKVVLLDKNWQKETFKKEYDAVFALRGPDGKQLEQFKTTHTIPVTTQSARMVVGEIDAKSAASHFQHYLPFFAYFITTDQQSIAEKVKSDMAVFFSQNPGDSYPSVRSINIVALLCKDQLIAQMETLVFRVRIALGVLWVLSMLLFAGFISFLAYRNLRVIHSPISH